jgi:uncharacterized protein YkwD
MRKTRDLLSILVVLTLTTGSLAWTSSDKSLPPPSTRQIRPDSSELEKASKLYQLVRKENHALRWDQCLARKAFLRAKQLVTSGQFEHEDRKTGKNPVWAQVMQCCRCRSAGENLAEGMESPENIHKALMKSPTHRKNIVDRRFGKVGVGCYDYVCVELFAGF